jgi:Cys-tRNA synthase (O-phospho-L-seryl-tRNA:Cys-tRNA synthase)
MATPCNPGFHPPPLYLPDHSNTVVEANLTAMTNYLAAQEAELARMELPEAERAERVQRAAHFAHAFSNAEEATRAARMRLGLASVRARSFM